VEFQGNPKEGEKIMVKGFKNQLQKITDRV
jgi:hypothetical protein